VLAPTAIEGRVVWPLWRTPAWNQHDVIALHLKSPPLWTGFNISQTIRDWSSGCTEAGHSMAWATTPETLAEAPMVRRIVAISRTTAHRHGIKRPTTQAVSCETASPSPSSGQHPAHRSIASEACPFDDACRVIARHRRRACRCRPHSHIALKAHTPPRVRFRSHITSRVSDVRIPAGRTPASSPIRT
jgi:hypothetical protein